MEIHLMHIKHNKFINIIWEYLNNLFKMDTYYKLKVPKVVKKTLLLQVYKNCLSYLAILIQLIRIFFCYIKFKSRMGCFTHKIGYTISCFYDII